MKRTLVAAAMILFVTLTCVAREIVVSSAADSGQATLRWALAIAGSGDVITFDPTVFPPGSPETIQVRNGLPALQRGTLTIDASDAGVILDGSSMPDGTTDGFYIISDGNVIRGLQIIGFPANGITLDQGASNNVIGGDRSIGEGPVGQGNVISKNRQRGIGIFGKAAKANLIQGNVIGTDVTEALDWGNQWEGIFIESAGNRVGPDNVIAFNKRYGIQIVAGAEGNTITRNGIYANEQPGIRTFTGPAAPSLVEFNLALGVATGRSCAGCSIELYSDQGSQGGRYEAGTLTDAQGFFAIDVDHAFHGPNLTVLATGPSNSTSVFSAPRSGLSFTLSMQQGNESPTTPLLSGETVLTSGNKLGGELGGWGLEWVDWEVTDGRSQEYDHLMESVRSRGLTWVRLSNWQSPLTWQEALQSDGTYAVPKDCDEFITALSDLGVEMILVLAAGAGLGGPEYDMLGWEFGTPGNGMLGNQEPEWWFRAKQERDQFCDFARFMVEHFKDRIAYYEIWNEPDSGENPGDPRGGVHLADYVRLVEQVAPIIHRTDPEAHVVVGSVGRFYDEDERWLSELLQSSVATVVDAVSWHPFYGESPALYSGLYTEHPEPFYWRDYPENVRVFVRAAAAEGFSGQYMAQEMVWRTAIDGNPNEPPVYTDTQAAKYMARASLMHLGIGMFSMVGTQIPFPDVTRGLPQEYVIQNLSGVLASHEAIEMPVEIETEYGGPVAYCAFRYPNGDRMLAVWTDGVAEDEDPGVPATITFPGLAAGSVTGIDVLHGFEQELILEVDGEDTIVRDLLVKDNPILIRLSDVTFGATYEEAVGDGFHRLGDPSAAPTGSGADRDGDGVPDDKDLCPDWPGSEATGGC
ncbi:NosD domain-containing protein [Candidatus Bipolaricaulota bacterium]